MLKLTSMLTFSAAAGWGVHTFATPYMGWATFTYGILLTGLVHKKNRKLHVPLMNVGIIFDLGLVLLLEYQRSAIATATSFSLTPLQQAHIGFSTLATLFYFPTLILGWKLYRNSDATQHLRSRHKMMGGLAFIFRTLGLILMFSLLSHVVTQ